MAAHADEIGNLGGGVIGVGPAAAHQARHLISRGIPFPLLLEPEHQLASAVGLERQPLRRFLFHLGGWVRWARSLRRARQGRITGAYWEVPAVVLVDPDCRVLWVHRGRFLGDYPAIDETLDRLRAAVS